MIPFTEARASVVNCRYQALAQACAVCSPGPGVLSAMGIFRQSSDSAYRSVLVVGRWSGMADGKMFAQHGVLLTGLYVTQYDSVGRSGQAWRRFDCG